MRSDSLLLAEELLLVLVHAPPGRRPLSWQVDAGLAAALLFDLLEGGWLAHDAGLFGRTREPVPRHPLLVAAIGATPAERSIDAERLLQAVKRGLRPVERRVAQSLERRRILRLRVTNLLGLLRLRRVEQLVPGAGNEVRTRTTRALMSEGPVDRRTALLVGLVRRLGLIRTLVDREHRGQAERRAAVLTEAEILGPGLAQAMREVDDAIAVAGGAAAAAGVAGAAAA